MPSYPISSLLKNQSCNLDPDNVRPTYPCSHIPCHDPDWLENEGEFLKDPDSNLCLWDCYRSSLQNPSLMLQIQAQTPPEKWAAYELKFDRSRRIIAKQAEIDKVIDTTDVKQPKLGN